MLFKDKDLTKKSAESAESCPEKCKPYVRQKKSLDFTKTRARFGSRDGSLMVCLTGKADLTRSLVHLGACT